MSFFKDFKEDLSQAVNELVPGGEEFETLENDNDMVVNTLEDELDVQSELSKLDGLLEKVSKDAKEPAIQIKPAAPKAPAAKAQDAKAAAAKAQDARAAAAVPRNVKPAAATKAMAEEKPAVSALDMAHKSENKEFYTQEEKKMSETLNETLAAEAIPPVEAPVQMPVQAEPPVVTDEVSVITEGTNITGNMSSNGSLDIRGSIKGDVQCNGKLVVTGTINGNSNSAEFFADAAKVEGEVVSTGTVKIGLGSIIIGNITASSAVIAGAIKGDIDVQGPVVVDTSAVVMGNIKSRSVQINNGAVIEGFCSQCYADIDVDSLFGDK